MDALPLWLSADQMMSWADLPWVPAIMVGAAITVAATVLLARLAWEGIKWIRNAAR